MDTSGVNLPMSLVGDSHDMSGNMMVLMSDLGPVDAEFLDVDKLNLIVYKNVSSQTDFDDYGGSSFPILFSGLLSNECEAFTQCNIPRKVNVGVNCNTVPEVSVSSNSSSDAIRISVETKSSNVTFSTAEIKESKPKNRPNEDIVFRPVGIKPSLIVPPASSNSDRGPNGAKIRVSSGFTDVSSLKGKSSRESPVRVFSMPSNKRKYTDDFDGFSTYSGINEDEANLWDQSAVDVALERKQRADIAYSASVDEDPQLKVVEQCLKNIKTEPTEGMEFQTKLLVTEEELEEHRISRRTRKSLLSSVLQENIKIETEAEWITDDEDDEDYEDFTEKLEQTMKDEGERTCKECNLTFNSHLLLIEHTESNHVANICSYCGFTTTFKNKLDRHVVKHTKEKAFVCDMCGKQYSQKQNLRDHISRYHSEEDSSSRYPYSCEYCKRMYRNENNLTKHLESQGGKCNTCGEVLPCSGLLFRHKKNHASSSCEYCAKTFQSKSALQIHVNIKHKDKGLQCSMCPKKFLFPSYLKLHFANAHSQCTPQYKCQECGFCAVTESYLKSHMTRMHSGSEKRKYTCQVCRKNFRSNARLVEHTRIHTGERPFACPVCFKTFYSQSNLYAHERTVHGRLNNYGSKDMIEENENPPVMKKVFSSCYQCQSCSETFSNKKKLKAHMENEHNICDDGDKATFEEMVSDMTDIEVAPMQFEMDNETVVQSEEYMVNGKDDDTVQPSPEDALNAKPALSLPAYVVPPNVNLVEIDGVQYHVIRSNP
ncbi:zinc finger protein 665-like [Palaemon carinicauda]|uniref:zinc finger protein 665-like n=1 Tax=Palaemon carinicauda TaxID=392227 RepID=UPI0035B66B90